MKKIIKQIPNILTLSRLILVVLAYYFLLFDSYETAIIIVIVAGLTDAFDGYLARKLKAITKFGAKLDQVVDKVFEIFLMFAGIFLGNKYLLVSLGLEIIFLVVCFIKLKRLKKWIPTIKCGKIKTALLFITIIFSLLGLHFESFKALSYPLVIVTIFYQIYTMIMYIKMKRTD